MGLRWIGAGIAGLLLLAALGYASGRQTPVDLVAQLRAKTGVRFESGNVAIPGQDVSLHVVQVGDPHGPPVLMLHGFPEFWWAWRQQLVDLASLNFRAIAPDQRGYNASDKPDAVDAYSLDVLRADVVGLIDALGYEDVFLVGHDWGATVAWQVAIHHPERVRKLLIFQGAHPQAFATVAEDASKIRWFRSFFQLPVLPELVARFGNWGLLARNLRATSREDTFSDEALAPYRQAWDRQGAMRSMIHWYRADARHPRDLSGDQTVRVPTRIVFGLDDAFIDVRYARASPRFCSRAELVELPGVGHWILAEEPRLVSEQIFEFFDPQGRERPRHLVEPAGP